MPDSVARGGSRSAPESRNVAPSNWASCGPNMLTADRRGEPVARKTSVPRARPPIVWAAAEAAKESRNGVNSGVRNRVR
jgi:hypothetical protein